METRMEKNRRKRMGKIMFILKSGLLLILLSFVIIGVNMVNISIKDLNCIENTNLFSFDFENSKLDFLGKSYLIDLKVLKLD